MEKKLKDSIAPNPTSLKNLDKKDPAPKKEEVLNENGPYSKNPEFRKYLSELNELRFDGESKEISIRNQIQDVKLNNQIDKESKTKLINDSKAQLAEAKVNADKKKEQVKTLVSKAIELSQNEWKPYYEKIAEEENNYIREAKAEYKEEIAKEKEEHAKRLEEINQNSSNLNKEDLKVKVKAERILFKSHKEEKRSIKESKIQKAKDNKYNAYMEKYGYATQVRNNKHSFMESMEFKFRHYLYTFNAKDYFLRNALYFVIIICFIVFVIASKGNLLTGDNIVGILSQSSVKLFYSLGVAGLILIAGTDLSIGRMTGMGVTFACIFLSDYTYEDKFGRVLFNLTGLNWGTRIFLALLMCIVMCVLFSSIAGFFTSKFKMHPFITTLSTSLLMFGFMELIYSNQATFKMNGTIKSNIIGSQGWILIVYAAIATIIVWFIWNKTKFGKYMYAVGGNAEAAAVSGINVFKVTMGIFIMAGVLYGFGGFFTAAQVGSGNPASGFGTELDAIAACVVGGISFSGGVGKIKGAVIGTIIFTGLTYCLTNLGYDPNIQYIFKGAIIMAAVCLDSLKYLKKK